MARVAPLASTPPPLALLPPQSSALGEGAGRLLGQWQRFTMVRGARAEGRGLVARVEGGCEDADGGGGVAGRPVAD